MGLLDIKKNFTTNQSVAECEQQLKGLEFKIAEIYKSIGKYYAEEVTLEQATGTAYEKYLMELAALEERRVLLEKKKLAVQGLRKCEACGNILSVESAFCNKCGGKLPEENLTAEPLPEDSVVCPGCGATIKEGTAFCTKCGTKM